MTQPTWQPDCSLERQFLLALVGCDTPERMVVCRELSSRIDWNHLLDTAQPELYPYMDFCIESRLGSTLCPEDVLRRLRGARRMTALHNLRLFAELRIISEAFARRRIPFMVLKGMVLAHSAYADASLRPMQDIDLLVASDHRQIAQQLLSEMGYECPERLSAANPSLRPLLHEESEIVFGMQKRGTRVLVEVHTQLEIAEPLFPVSISDVWGRSVSTCLHGLQVHTLGERDFLFHLCLHLSRNHAYNIGLLPLVDILKWTGLHHDCDWNLVASESAAKGYGPYMRLTLELTRDLLGAPITASLVSDMPDVDVLKRMAWRQMWDDHRAANAAPEGLVRIFADKSMKGRTRALLRRLNPAHGCDPGSWRQSSRPFPTALRRILIDLKIKAPKYLRSLLRGNLHPSRLRDAIHRFRERERLAALLKKSGSA